MLNFVSDAEAPERVRVLTELLDILGPRDIGKPQINEFTVTRTNDRKGHRDSRPFNNTSPYQEDPMVRVQIDVEFPDNATRAMPQLVEDLKQIERARQIMAASEQLRRAEAEERVAVERRERAAEILRKAKG